MTIGLGVGIAVFVVELLKATDVVILIHRWNVAVGIDVFRWNVGVRFFYDGSVAVGFLYDRSVAVGFFYDRSVAVGLFYDRGIAVRVVLCDWSIIGHRRCVGIVMIDWCVG